MSRAGQVTRTEPGIRHNHKSAVQRMFERFDTARGRKKVDAQWKLFCTVYNIGKLARYGGHGYSRESPLLKKEGVNDRPHLELKPLFGKKTPYQDFSYSLSAKPTCALAATERSEKASPYSALLGFVVMLHSYDYISLFVSFVDIPVSLGSLFQRIASIYDRFYLSRLNNLFEEN